MKTTYSLNLIAIALGTALLTGCGDAETTINELPPIEQPDDDHDHDHDHGDGDGHDHNDDYSIESMGRLAVMDADSNALHLFDLDDNSMLDSINLAYDDMTLSASANYRYATAKARSEDLVQFVDGGLWREDHGDHPHDYEQAPALTGYELMGSRPTHAVSHDGQLAVFNDGNADAGTTASVHVVTDGMVANDTDPRELMLDINMHGAAEPRGDHLLVSLRRDDAESTSSNKILPDQVGVFHWHDGEYELEQTLEEACPNLHGAAQNHDYVAFGCGDGVLLAHAHDDEYEAHKIANSADIQDGLRVGVIYGHHDSEQFIGMAYGHGGGEYQIVAINPAEEVMDVIDWQPMDNARPLQQGFAHGGEHYLILDSQGYLTVLEAHAHDDETHWEYLDRIDITEEDVTTMPEGLNFSMTVAQNGHYVFVADPIAQHVLQIHVEDMEIEGDIELDAAPAGIVWLGIAEEGEHDHE